MFLNLQSSPTKPPIELKETFKLISMELVFNNLYIHHISAWKLTSAVNL